MLIDRTHILISMLVLAMLGFMARPLPAEAQKTTGAISGVVVDAKNGETLVGANVVIKGTTTGTTTDLEGRYKLKNLEPGSYALVFSFMGFQTKTVQGVDVTAGKTAPLDVSLAPQTEELDEVIVTAEAARNSDAGLLKQRQKAAAVSNAISAEAIGRSGSATAANAMEKVTGASVVGGKYVNVRGVGGRYVNVQLNGADLPSADPDRNTVPLDLFPAGLLENIVVSKTFTPDKSGSFTGGNVDLGTKSFPERLVLSFSSSASYESEVGFGNMLRVSGGAGSVPENVDEGSLFHIDPTLFGPEMRPVTKDAPMNQSYGLTFGNQFEVLGGRPLGVVASLTYDQSVDGHDSGEVGQYELVTSVDQASGLSTDFDLNDDVGQRETLMGGLANVAFKPHPLHEVGLNLLYNRSDQEFARFQSGSFPRDLTSGLYLNRVLQTVERDLISIQGRGDHVFGSGPSGVRVEWNSSYSSTTQDEPDFRIFTSDRDTTRSPTIHRIQPSIYPQPTRYFRAMDETSWSNDLKTTIPMGAASMKVGGSYLRKARTFRERRFQYLDAESYSGNPEAYFRSTPLREISQASNNYDAEQTVAAGLAMVDAPLSFISSDLRLIGGLRVEYTDQVVKNFETLDLEEIGQTGQIETTDLLPSANLVYSILDDMNLRLAYGRTLARPSFREFAPFNAYDFVNATQIVGNPELERTTVHNFDARWEWFPRPNEVLAVSGFYKRFNGPIEQVLNPNAVNREVTYENAEDATVFGLELEARTRLDRLAPWLQYVEAGGNLTLTHSAVSIADRELELIRAKNPSADDTRRLQGQSPFVVNLDVAYENPEQGTNVALYYNVFGKRLDTIARAATPNLFEQPRHVLDLVMSQRIPFGLELGASVKNILGADYEVSQSFKGKTFVNYGYEIGRSISLSLKYRL